MPVGRAAFAFPALTYFSERPSDRIPYLTLFPIGTTMRANLFAYREVDDPWLREMRRAPVETLECRAAAAASGSPANSTLPATSRSGRPISMSAPATAQPGIVLVGDAFATTCPVAGHRHRQGVHRRRPALQCPYPGLACDRRHGARPRSRRSTTDPVKRACDAWSAAKAFSFRSVSIDDGLYWQAQRWARFLGVARPGLVRGGVRDGLRRGAEPRSLLSSSSSSSSSSSLSSSA